MNKLSPELEVALSNKKAEREAIANRQVPPPGTPAMALSSPDKITLHVEFAGDLQEIMALGFSPTGGAGQFYIGDIDIDQVEALAQHPQIIRLSTPTPKQLLLDNSIPDIKANQVWSRAGSTFSNLTGKDVIVGVIDTGIDYQHRTFRDPADPSKSRVLFIWDQTLIPTGTEASPGQVTHATLPPQALGYGVEFGKTTIESALANSHPTSVVRHRDIDGHGTHVASTAAGNGSQSGGCHGSFHYIGVAPEASLIIVRMFGLTKAQDGYVGDRNLNPNPIPAGRDPYIDAIRYVAARAQAAGKAFVINMSLGSFIGARNGSNSDEQMVDAIATAYTPGSAIVIAAGNEAADKRHLQGAVAASATIQITLKVKANTTSTIFLDIQYSGSNLRARLQAPQSGAWQSWVTAGNSTPFNGINNSGNARINNQADRIVMTLSPPTAPPNTTNLGGNWLLELNDTAATITNIHVYRSEDTLALFDNENLPAGIQISDVSTCSVQASGDNVIIVGAYSLEGSTSNQLANFSGRGPVFRTCPPGNPSCNLRPHVIAPGVAITAAALDKERACSCCCDCCEDYYIDLQGTSMATPHVAGAVALMLNKNATRSFSDLRTDLQNAAAGRRDITIPGVDPIPAASWPRNDAGWGKLDVQAAVNLTPVVPPVSPPAPVTAVPLVAAPQLAPVEGPAALFASAYSLHQRMLACAAGCQLNQLAHTHFREIRDLINKNKRVAVVWHRNQGPALIRLSMRAASLPLEPIPARLEGEPLVEKVDRIIDIILRYASEALYRDAQPYRYLTEHLQDGLSLEAWMQLIEKYEALSPTARSRVTSL